MKYILSIILSFFAGCLVIISVYNYKDMDTVIVKEETQTIINETNSIKTSIDKVYNSVLTVLGYTNSDSVSTVGTAFIYKIDEDYAYILTNYHVIKNLNKIEVRNMDEITNEAEVVGFDEYKDVAVLKTSKDISSTPVVFADSSKIELGDTVFTVGSPLSEEYYGTVTKGIISYKNRIINTTVNGESVLIDTIQTSTPINPGNSGGPLVDVNGEVIGIITSKIIKNEIEGLGFAIPINDVKSIIELLEVGKTESRIKIDFKSIDLNDNYDLYKNELYLDNDYEYGIYVKSIDKNSIFRDIIKDNDIILKVNEKNIENTKYFEYLINKNNNIKLEIKRDNEIISLDFIK